MVQLYYSMDDTVLVKIAGDNFMDLKNLLKDANATYKSVGLTKLGEEIPKVWELDFLVADRVIRSMGEIEPIRIPDWVKPATEDDNKEFIRFRTELDENCIKGEWKGDYQRKGVLRGISQNRLALYWEMGCVAEGTQITVNRGGNVVKENIEELYRWSKSSRLRKGGAFSIRCLKDGHFGQHPAAGIVFSGEKECVELCLSSGKKILLTPDHEVLTSEGWAPADSLNSEYRVIVNGTPVCTDCGETEDVCADSSLKGYGLCKREIIVTPREDQVVSVTPVGIRKTYDIKMTAPYHNFIANGIVVHNCGKTFTIQTILNHLVERGDVKKYVVISPPEGVINLAYEFLRFNSFGLTKEQIYICSTEKRNPFEDPNIRVVIMSYRNLIMLHDDFRKATGKEGRSSRVAKNYIPFDKLGDKLALLCDECFIGSTPITTDAGIFSIQEIVEDRMGSHVLSYNHDTGREEYKRIISRETKPLDRRLVRVNVGFAYIICTEDHRIYTKNRGYVEALHLTKEDALVLQREELRTVRSDVRSKIPETEVLQSELLGKMANVQARDSVDYRKESVRCFSKEERIYSKTLLRTMWSRTGSATEKVLHCAVFKPYSNVGSRAERVISKVCGWETTEVYERAKESRICSDDREQPDEKRFFTTEDGCIYARKEAQGAGRKWKNGSLPEVSIRSVKVSIARRDKDTDGASSENFSSVGRVSTVQTTDKLQDRHCLAGVHASNRSRRGVPQESRTEEYRSEERYSAVEARVGSVTILERGDYKQYGLSDPEDTIVYDLEVEDNHNFFANGILVHNCQYVRNPDSKTFKVLDKAKGFFEYRYMLSGTPSPKYAGNLWAQFHILSPKSVPSDFMTFAKSVASVGNKYSPYNINFYYEDRVNEFLKSVEYLVSREVTEGNLVLPPLSVKEIRCQLSPKQKQIYQMVVDSTLASIKEEHGRVVPSIIRNKFSHLSLALHDPGLLLNGNLDLSRTSPALIALLKSWKFEDNGKMEIADSLLARYIEEEGNRAILWSGHPYILNKLSKIYEKKYHPYVLHGETEMLKGESTAERNHRVVESFKADPKSKLLLANYSVLKTSVNIVEVTRNVYWDRSWEADVFEQSYKRTHRIGQTKDVLVNPLIFAGSLEEYQHREIMSRIEFNRDLWVGDGATLEDCKMLFRGEGLL